MATGLSPAPRPSGCCANTGASPSGRSRHRWSWRMPGGSHSELTNPFPPAWSGDSAAQVRLEEVHGALPGKARGRFVVARRGVVVEPVLCARIREHLVLHVVGLERGLERRDAGVDPVVLPGV